MALLKTLNTKELHTKENPPLVKIAAGNEKSFSYVSQFTNEALADIITTYSDVDISKNRYVPGLRVRGETNHGSLCVDLLDRSIGFIINSGDIKTKNGHRYVTLCGVENKQIDALMYLLTQLKESRAGLIGPILETADEEHYDNSDTDEFDD